MKTVAFIMYYIQIAAAIYCLIALIWSILTDDFAIALLNGVLLLLNIIAAAIATEYEKPRQQMFNFINKYLK